MGGVWDADYRPILGTDGRHPHDGEEDSRYIDINGNLAHRDLWTGRHSEQTTERYAAKPWRSK